ncbi:hypothetical protein GJ744_007970 [Endocarpon pusillum]|uniref:DUF7924 domain-containing protein n=1 Tax=Endocarpon pusillum TaxID=364733 RepID=A0A8H7AR11_9EURO|nr:hypothetical protein GJ744_007970 [Endocarpon pusillum]
MSIEVLCPKPQRPHKRVLADITSDISPVSKHARRSSPPLPTPSTPSRRPISQSLKDFDNRSACPRKRRRLQSPRFEPTDNQHLQVIRSGSAPPWPTCAPGSKHCLPQLPTESPVDAWISAVSSLDPRPIYSPSDRPSTCPAIVNLSKDKRTPLSLATIKKMSQQQPQYAQSQEPTSGASQNGRPGTSSPLYRDTIYNNYITMDLSGRRLPQKLRDYADEHILKQRTSPQLGDEVISEIIDTAEELADSSEGPTNKLLRTSMFPIDHSGIAEGGNTPWNTIALPDNPEYEFSLAAPKPDAYLGYSRGQQSGWSTSQYNVINHLRARPYTQPGRGNTFPFLVFELKSEAAGGTLYAAENQAAGSGSHSVNALLWLLQEAQRSGLSDTDLMMDTVSFSFVISHREAVFYMHWQSTEEKRFYMSRLKSYSTFEPDEIRACNNAVKNTVEDALGARKTKIGSALQALFPIPQHWNQVCTNPLTPTASFSDNSRPPKKGRR